MRLGEAHGGRYIRCALAFRVLARFLHSLRVAASEFAHCLLTDAKSLCGPLQPLLALCGLRATHGLSRSCITNPPSILDQVTSYASHYA